MRWGTLAASFALLVPAGCVAPGPGGSAAERRWQSVCERMRCACADDPIPTAASVSPAADEVAALRRSAARAAASVVRISTRIEQAQPDEGAPGPLRTAARPSGGTGVVIDASGLILTCAHVVDRARDIRVHLPGADDAAAVAGTCVARDARRDLALIRVPCDGLQSICIAPCDPPDDAPVVAIGALTRTPDQRHGRITVLDVSLEAALNHASEADYSALIETTAALEPGFSGGPLLDTSGRLVGINVAMRTGRDGARRSYAIGLDPDCCAAIRRMCAEAGM